MQIAILVLFHILFFFEIYRKPNTVCTSELAHTTFPSWVWMGRQVRKLRSWKTEPFYWLNFHAHPMLSPYYPPNVLTAFISSFLNLDGAFRLKVYTTYAHLLAQSLFWFWTLSCYFEPNTALFGAITFTYCGWNVRIQPCIMHTLTWVPLLFYPNALISGTALGLMVLGGYFPYTLFFVPFALVFNPTSVWGFALGLPQLVPFIRYLPKTVKIKRAEDASWGHWEHQWYFGIVPILLIISWQTAVTVFLFLVLSWAIKSYLPRVYFRSHILLTYYLVFLSVCMVTVTVPLLLLHCFDLWIHNRKLIPTRPYTEMYRNPKWDFSTSATRFLIGRLGKSRVSGLPYPNQTGLIHEFRTLGYCGTMANRMMIGFRGGASANCLGRNDWFEENEDDKRLHGYRVRYAVTSKKIPWTPTGIHNLWRNPRD